MNENENNFAGEPFRNPSVPGNQPPYQQPPHQQASYQQPPYQQPPYQQAPYQQPPYQQPPYQQPPYQQAPYQQPPYQQAQYQQPPAAPKLPGTGVILAFGIVSMAVGIASVIYSASIFSFVPSRRHVSSMISVPIILAVLTSIVSLVFGIITMSKTRNFVNSYRVQVPRVKTGMGMSIAGLCTSGLAILLTLIAVIVVFA